MGATRQLGGTAGDEASAHARPRAPWLRSPAWDLGGLAFCWLPFYAFVVFGLGLTGQWSAGGRAGGGYEPGLGLAMVVALGISYVHRHYTFLLVYGDAETFRQRQRAYVVLPALLFVGLAAVLRAQGELRIPVPGMPSGASPWLAVLTITGLWNVWHTVMQRHGILRIYAGKAGGGLQERAHGRRDLRLAWSVILLVAVVVLMFRQSTFAGIFNARRLLAVLEPATSGPIGWAALAAAAGVFAFHAAQWLRAERAAALSWRARVPRLSFLASTLALLAVFVVHGPIIGYLCFGTAHAIEYVFFLHHFGRRKFAQRPDEHGIVARMLRQPLRWAPVLVGSLLAAFWLLRDVHSSDAWLVYFTATSLLHFLYDGWIWKVRRPEVARPLGLQMAAGG